MGGWVGGGREGEKMGGKEWTSNTYSIVLPMCSACCITVTLVQNSVTTADNKLNACC